MSRTGIDRTLWPAVGTLALTFLLFEVTPLDLLVQNHLYDFAARRWLIDAHAAVPRALFYTGPKLVLITMGVALIALVVGPQSWRNRLHVPEPVRRNLLVAFLTLGTVPAFIGELKSVTNVFCPSEIRAYGGDQPYVRVLERHSDSDRPTRCGHCFPAGHASGGFALLGLVGLASSRRARVLTIVPGLAAGCIMGFYQMAKGAHFLSHTVVTALIAWILFLVWRRILRVTTPAAIGQTRP
ncbi:MAG: phosphatase PAP2 family protein [Opitutaceae bacterium]|nr:phosphatase PAP2 family protein [Opitutaceae bacterium]